MIIYYKQIGETTSSFSNRIKNELNLKCKVAICGKLNPMALGLVSILIDNETKLMDIYLKSIKTYKFDLVLGFSTDTDDIMGLINPVNDIDLINSVNPLNPLNRINDIDLINDNIYKYCTITSQPFHKFSAKKINIDGKSVKMYNSNISDNNYPKKEVEVYNIIQLKQSIIYDYKKYIFTKINKIPNEMKDIFRINSIIDKYELYDFKQSYIKLSYIITVSSGFYIRMISKYINDLGFQVHISDIERIETFLPKETFLEKV